MAKKPEPERSGTRPRAACFSVMLDSTGDIGVSAPPAHAARLRPTFILCAGVIAVSLLGAALLGVRAAMTAFGPMSTHMAEHVFLMNVAAPLAALGVQHFISAPRQPFQTGWMAGAALTQILALWTWHAPGAYAASVEGAIPHAAMRLTLFAAAFWFWAEVLAVRGPDRWRSLLALLTTGKLFCLLGALFLFAPRTLYDLHGHTPAMTGASLADQQLAGLIMLAACPMSYVLAGVIIAACWLYEMSGAASRAGAHLS